MHSRKLTQVNIARIAELFPNCVTEAMGRDGSMTQAVNFDQLKQELSDSIVEGPQERYFLNWPGKREALLAANSPISRTLRPLEEESVNFEHTRNIFIEGDNLEALKLLQESYLGRVKMIYIDPPYNTGHDFLYEDDFAENSQDYLIRTKQKSNQGVILTANTDANGRFHSDWLSMIYPRLKLARLLLTDDGIIFASIDDNEVANLRKVLDEIFGEDNFLQQLVWKRHAGGGNDSRHFATDHEYILAYAKNKDSLGRLRMPLTDEDKQDYKSKDRHFDALGPYKTKSFCRMRPDDPRPTLTYDITTPDGTTLRDTWKWEESRFLKALEEEKVQIRKDRNGKWQVEYKIYLNAVDDEEGQAEEKTKVPRSLLIDIERNSEGKKQLREAIGKDNIFNNPKPTGLIKHLMSFGSGPNDIILDFFAGSGSTGQAVMELNHAQNSSRRFILIQLPELCDEKSAAFKAGYKAIPEITKERLRSVGNTIKSGQPEGVRNDTGFRVLKIDTSNMADVYYSPDVFEQSNLELFVDNIKTDRKPADLLFQVMLDWGVDLAMPITKETIQGNEVFFVDGNALAACLDAHSGIDEAFVRELARRQPLRVVFRDAGFRDDAAKINVEQIFRLLSPASDIKCI
ncbi:site-specific DNA-methyltransferase [Comamonas sp. NLF-1-9]|nr:site-specific DNA-methyltransferase [Comamonas sp. NLF-1-9]